MWKNLPIDTMVYNLSWLLLIRNKIFRRRCNFGQMEEVFECKIARAEANQDQRMDDKCIKIFAVSSKQDKLFNIENLNYWTLGVDFVKKIWTKCLWIPTRKDVGLIPWFLQICLGHIKQIHQIINHIVWYIFPKIYYCIYSNFRYA